MNIVHVNKQKSGIKSFIADDFIDFVYNVYEIYKEFGNGFYRDMTFGRFYELANINGVWWKFILSAFIINSGFATIENNVITIKKQYVRS